MPNRRTHQVIGGSVAVAIALPLSGDLPPVGQLVYCLAAGVGGTTGGALPDILEPALHSHHRDVAHSFLAVSGIVATGASAATKFGVRLRAEAARLREERLSLPETDPRRSWLAVREHLIYAVLGFVLGFAVGYATHVIADLGTPRGVPLVSRHLI